MTKFKTIGYIICSLLLLMAFTGLVTQPIVLAAQKDTANIHPVSQAQEEEQQEKINLKCKYPVLKAYAGALFTYEIELKYEGGEKPRFFEFQVDVPDGFIYKIEKSYGGDEIPGLNLDPTAYAAEKIRFVLISFVDTGEYPVTLEVVSEEIKASIDLKAIVTARYGLSLVTPDGLLNTKIQAGKDNYFSFTITNTGTAELEKINFSSRVRGGPSGWSVTFNPPDIDSLPAGAEREIEITIKPPKKTIAGDYEITVSAEPEDKYDVEDSLDIRLTVLTPTIWGWVGIAIVIVIIAGLVVLFMRLGRR